MDFSSPEMQRRLIHTKVYYNFALSEKKQSLLSSACIILKKPSRGVLRKRCSENTQQIYRRNTHAEVWFQQICKSTLLKPHLGMDVLLWICCIFSEHLFLRTSLDGCLWINFLKDFTKFLQKPPEGVMFW